MGCQPVDQVQRQQTSARGVVMAGAEGGGLDQQRARRRDFVGIAAAETKKSRAETGVSSRASQGDPVDLGQSLMTSRVGALGGGQQRQDRSRPGIGEIGRRPPNDPSRLLISMPVPTGSGSRSPHRSGIRRPRGR